MEKEISKKVRSIGKVTKTQDNAVWIDASIKNFDRVFETVRKIGVEHISAISALEKAGQFQIIYNCEFNERFINIRFRIPVKTPKIKTITGVYPGAELYEREVSEMLGIEIVGHPNPIPLFLDERSPKKPLRRKEHG